MTIKTEVLIIGTHMLKIGDAELLVTKNALEEYRSVCKKQDTVEIIDGLLKDIKKSADKVINLVLEAKRD